jgi:ribosomal protein L40E
MIYCSNCGSQIADEAYFCSKCGTKTEKGKAAKVAYPSDELRDMFYQVGNELEKAFNVAARETHTAFQKAKENWQQSQPTQKPQNMICTQCSANSPDGSVYCRTCGAKLGTN